MIAGPSRPSSVGDAAGCDAGRDAGHPVALELLVQPLEAEDVVLRADPGEDAGRSCHAARRDRCRRSPAPPSRFQQQPLLRIHAPAPRAATMPKKLGVEVGDVVEEAALARVGRTGPARGRGRRARSRSQPRSCGELGDPVAHPRDQLPERLRRIDPAGKAAGHADDRDRLLGGLSPDRYPLRRRGADHFRSAGSRPAPSGSGSRSRSPPAAPARSRWRAGCAARPRRGSRSRDP